MKIAKEDLKTLETLKKKNTTMFSWATSQFNSIVSKVNAYVDNYNKDFEKFIADKRSNLASLQAEIADYARKKVNEIPIAEQEKRNAIIKFAATLKKEEDYLESNDFKNGHMY